MEGAAAEVEPVEGEPAEEGPADVEAVEEGAVEEAVEGKTGLISNFAIVYEY